MMQKWEYQIEYIHNHAPIDIQFNELGHEGWELVAVSDNRAFFKCPVGTLAKTDAPTCGSEDCSQGYGFPCEACGISTRD